jgi:type I restriction enzyme S subunit
MEEWKEYKLGDILNFRRGHDLPHSKMKDGNIPVAGSNGIIGYHNEATPVSPCITIGRSGNVGTPYIYKQCWAHNTVLYVDDFKQNDPLYLYYLLKTLPLSSFGGGSAVPTLNRNHIHPLIIKHTPNINTQRQIASILKSLDDKIEVNRRINDNLEQQAQALFKSWFVDFEPFKDGELVESELGMIPKGWRVGILNELGDIVGGSTPSKAKAEYYTNDGIAWLTPKDLSISQRKFTSKGEIDITQEGYESCSTKLMPRGSVLFSSRAPIGYITIAKNDICTNQGFKSVIPKLAGTAFLYCFLKESTQEIENKATGSTFKEASGTLMKSLPTIIPEKAVLDDFEDLLSPLFYQQEVVEEENSLLSSLRDSILPRLMSGKLNASEINM